MQLFRLHVNDTCDVNHINQKRYPSKTLSACSNCTWTDQTSFKIFVSGVLLDFDTGKLLSLKMAECKFRFYKQAYETWENCHKPLSTLLNHLVD